MPSNKADNSYKAGKENLRLEFYSSLMENHLPRTLVQVLKNRLVESISWRGASSRKGAISVETQWSGQMFYGVSLCRDKCCINYDDSSSTKGGVIVIKYINSTIYRSCAEWDVLKRYVCSNACHVVPFTNKTYILTKSKDKDFLRINILKNILKAKVCATMNLQTAYCPAIWAHRTSARYLMKRLLDATVISWQTDECFADSDVLNVSYMIRGKSLPAFTKLVLLSATT